MLIEIPIYSLFHSTIEMHWLFRYGFVVGRGIISAEQAARTAADIWEFAGREAHRELDFYLDPADHDSWYDESGKCGFKKAVEIYHSQAMWENKYVGPRRCLRCRALCKFCK